MSVTPEFIAKARALAFYRKFKTRRAHRKGTIYCDSNAPFGWEKLDAGAFGEVWEHEDHFGYVVKISGRAGFGINELPYDEPSLDGWPTFAQHCQAHPHPNLPKIMHFERLSLGVSFGIMPWYETIDSIRDYLEGNGIPLKGKVYAIGLMWASIGLSCYLVPMPWARAFMLTSAVLVTLYILRQKTLPARD